MNRPSHSSRSLRLCALVHLGLMLSGCTSWQVQPVPPAEFLASQKPSSVRVTRTDRSRLTLFDPGIQGDSITGLTGGAVPDSSSQPASIALSDVQELAVLKPDPTKNTLLVVGLAVTTFSTLCFLADAFGCGPDFNTAPLFGLSPLD